MASRLDWHRKSRPLPIKQRIWRNTGFAARVMRSTHGFACRRKSSVASRSAWSNCATRSLTSRLSPTSPVLMMAAAAISSDQPVCQHGQACCLSCEVLPVARSTMPNAHTWARPGDRQYAGQFANLVAQMSWPQASRRACGLCIYSEASA